MLCESLFHIIYGASEGAPFRLRAIDPVNSSIPQPLAHIGFVRQNGGLCGTCAAGGGDALRESFGPNYETKPM